MGNWCRCTHNTCFTAYLQENNLTDLSSVTVQQFHAPALNLICAPGGSHAPSGGGGVGNLRLGKGAHKNPNPPAAFGCQLQSAGLQLGETGERSDGCADAFAAQAFGQRPQLIRGIGAAKENQAMQIERQACR